MFTYTPEKQQRTNNTKTFINNLLPQKRTMKKNKGYFEELCRTNKCLYCGRKLEGLTPCGCLETMRKKKMWHTSAKGRRSKENVGMKKRQNRIDYENIKQIKPKYL